ncbi:uncharacterized protein G2W53_039781 [Senna tora]|uniref:Uncharacterized protein n=1 Tax=Senna tora TaxID=362788 RepID=A0A834W350_9FABA|nr:uncharacterized protein G2W53_039781 [Senna tora]
MEDCAGSANRTSKSWGRLSSLRGASTEIRDELVCAGNNPTRLWSRGCER